MFVSAFFIVSLFAGSFNESTTVRFSFPTIFSFAYSFNNESGSFSSSFDEIWRVTPNGVVFPLSNSRSSRWNGSGGRDKVSGSFITFISSYDACSGVTELQKTVQQPEGRQRQQQLYKLLRRTFSSLGVSPSWTTLASTFSDPHFYVMLYHHFYNTEPSILQ